MGKLIVKVDRAGRPLAMHSASRQEDMEHWAKWNLPGWIGVHVVKMCQSGELLTERHVSATVGDVTIEMEVKE